MLLPLDADVYTVEYEGQDLFILRESLKEYYCQYLKFIFDENDKLWATEWVREIWSAHPHRHPHASLFTLLYKKLEI